MQNLTGEGREEESNWEREGVLWKMHKSGEFSSARIILSRLLSSTVFNFSNMW